MVFIIDVIVLEVALEIHSVILEFVDAIMDTMHIMVPAGMMT